MSGFFQWVKAALAAVYERDGLLGLAVVAAVTVAFTAGLVWISGVDVAQVVEWWLGD